MKGWEGREGRGGIKIVRVAVWSLIAGNGIIPAMNHRECRSLSSLEPEQWPIDSTVVAFLRLLLCTTRAGDRRQRAPGVVTTRNHCNPQFQDSTVDNPTHVLLTRHASIWNIIILFQEKNIIESFLFLSVVYRFSFKYRLFCNTRLHKNRDNCSISTTKTIV